MIILGYNGFSRAADLFARLYGHTRDSIDRHCVLGHDAGAALFIDGNLVAAVEEERLSRQRKTSAFPLHAIQWCLEDAGLTLDDVDQFAFGWDFDEEYAASAISAIAGTRMPAELKFTALSSIGILYGGALGKRALLSDFEAQTGHRIAPERLLTVPHHRAHLACGRVFAGPDDAAFFVSDGRSEQDSAILGEIRGDRVQVFPQLTVDMANSIAQLFAEVTRYLGFVPNSDEYKVMGLASYEPAPAPGENPLLRRVVSLEDTGRFTLALAGNPAGTAAYRPLFDEIFDSTSAGRDTFTFRARVAAAAQQMIEEVTVHQLRALARATDLRTLLFEGGLALNCVNNIRLLERLPFDRLEVSCGASDPGIAIGAAAYAAERTASPPRHGGSPYLGPAYPPSRILAALEHNADALTWLRLPPGKIAATVAHLLEEKVVVGWFQGAAEYGPRALGNRSILANPSYPDMKDIINTKVKHREPFRPFAPVVLEDVAPKIFDMGKKQRSPYMTFVYPVRTEFRDSIAAAVHIDGTSRIQTVTPAGNPLLATLLTEFSTRTGIPCLVNTSFNVAGEPIVCSPDDAITCFLNTEIDYLAIGDFLVTKSAVPSTAPTGTPSPSSSGGHAAELA